MTKSNDRKRILISRLSAIGDCIVTMPLASALKRQWPNCEITWVVDCAASQLLDKHGSVDHVIRVKKGFLKRPSDVLKLRSQLREQSFEIAIDPQGLTKSGIVSWISGAKVRIGFQPPQAREIAPWFYTNAVERTAPHVVDAYLELLAPLGVANQKVDFNIPAEPEAETFAETQLAGLVGGCRFAVINPGAGWMSKVWPVERYAAVANYLMEEHSLPSVVVWAGSEEQAWADQIVRESNGGALKAPATNLLQLSSILRRSAMFIGSDTGPMHLASAVGTPCIAMFGPTLPEEVGPYGPGHIKLQEKYQSGSARQRRAADNSAMAAIPASMVCKAATQILTTKAEPAMPAA